MLEEIRNARITSVSLGYEDHGILIFGLGLDIVGGSACVWEGTHSMSTIRHLIKECVELKVLS